MIDVPDAQQVLRDNDRNGHTVPTDGLYPFQWSWDSAITALGWLTFDERLQAAHARARTQRFLENQARVAVARGRLEEAAALLHELLARRPDDHEMRGRLAALLVKIGRADAARAEIERALAGSPDSASLQQTAAEVFMIVQQFGRARGAVDALLRIDPLHRSITGRSDFVSAAGLAIGPEGVWATVPSLDVAVNVTADARTIAEVDVGLAGDPGGEPTERELEDAAAVVDVDAHGLPLVGDGKQQLRVFAGS